MAGKISVIPVPSDFECLGKRNRAAGTCGYDCAADGIRPTAIKILRTVYRSPDCLVGWTVHCAIAFNRYDSSNFKRIESLRDNQIACPQSTHQLFASAFASRTLKREQQLQSPNRRKARRDEQQGLFVGTGHA